MISTIANVSLVVSGETQFPYWLPIIWFPVAWALLASMGSLMLSRIGGWGRLGEVYAFRGDFTGNIFKWQSAGFRHLTRYSYCLNVGASPDGLYMAQRLVFRMFHPPLLIPWNEVTAHPIRIWGFPFLELTFQRVPEVPVKIRLSLARKLAPFFAGRISVDA